MSDSAAIPLLGRPGPLLWQAQLKLVFAREMAGLSKQIFEQYLQTGSVRMVQQQSARDGSYGLYVEAAPLPIMLPQTIGAAIHSMRSSLDTAVSTLMTRARGSTDTRENFPMHETERELRNSFNSGPNAKMSKLLPDLVALMFDDFKPWKDGNYSLWALSKLDNINKHRMILPTLARVQSVDVTAVNPGMSGMMSGNDFGALSPGARNRVMSGPTPWIITDEGRCNGDILFPYNVPLHGELVFEALENLMRITAGIGMHSVETATGLSASFAMFREQVTQTVYAIVG